jgi:hypothetical protein
VVEHRPADGGDERREEGGAAIAQARDERRDHRNARDRKGDGDEPQAREPRVGEAGEIRQEIVERRAAPLAEHGPEHVAERVVADEEDERLVLVRRKGMQPQEQEGAQADSDRGHSEGVPVGRERPPGSAGGGWHSLVASAGRLRARC